MVFRRISYVAWRGKLGLFANAFFQYGGELVTGIYEAAFPSWG